MTDLSRRFLVVAVGCAMTGMAAGIAMAASHDFVLMPAHAHLNLLGWVTMALYGLYYRGDPIAAASRMALVQFWCATVGVALMVGALAAYLSGQSAAEPLIGVGSVLVVVAMALFGAVIFRSSKISPALTRSTAQRSSS